MIILLTFRLHYLQMTSNANFSVITTIMTQVVMHYCLMATTVPCIRIFLSVFNSWMRSSLKMQSPQRNQGLSQIYTVSSSRYMQNWIFTQNLDHSDNQAITRSQNQDIKHYSGCDPQIEARSIESDILNTQIIQKTGNWPLVDESPVHTTDGSEVQIYETCWCVSGGALVVCAFNHWITMYFTVYRICLCSGSQLFAALLKH